MDETFVTRYCRFASRSCDAPVVFHTFMAYHVMGVCLGRRVWLEHGMNNVYPNLWSLLIARSSTHRKSTAIGIAERLIKTVSYGLVYPHDWSREALYEIMANEPVGTLIEQEFIDLATRLRRKYNDGFMGVLTKLYDCPESHEYRIIGDRSRRRAGSSGDAEPARQSSIILQPTLSIASATTTTWLLQSLEEQEFSGGFLPRFVFVPAFSKERSMAFPPKADKKAQAALMEEILAIRAAARGELGICDDAKTAYSSWFADIERRADKEGGVFGPVLVRLQTVALKYAVINAAMRLSQEISETDIRNGMHMAEWSWHEFSKLKTLEFAFGRDEKNRKKVLDAVRSAGAPGIPHSAILRKTRMFARLLDEILDSLQQEELITVEIVKVKDRGRPGRVYRWIEYPSGVKGDQTSG
jgi:hypothetical protein